MRFLSLLLLASTLSAQSLWVVLAADTSDPVLGRSSVQDLALWRSFLPLVASSSGLELRLTVLEGSRLRAASVREALAGVTPGRDDAVLFYYSGAGVASGSRNQWPRLFLPDRQLLDLQALFQNLAGKDPRLLVVLAETGQGAERQPRDGTVSSQVQPVFLRRLWRESRGAVLAAAASSGETALSFAEGGAFTVSLLEILRTAESSDWNQILQAGANLVRETTFQAQNPLVQYTPLQRPASPPAITTPPQVLDSNEGFSPWVLVGSGAVFFQNGNDSWMYIPSGRRPPVRLKTDSRTMSHLILKDSQGTAWRAPIPGSSLRELRRQEGGRWVTVFSGVWRQTVYRYTEASAPP